ncbi:ACT domain-containing protein [Leisingera sp. SS27]|uniref:ACT domain-containing protein n=1 Tax=Leisingera sp. SS27 TaxID=2979462 RepID=UPI0023304A50|nr:ACT domain-containing protein [Leisingera sp. SS27]MDC0658266.1 ACT domain-containing protein [Leisingera sp. SS27]
MKLKLQMRGLPGEYAVSRLAPGAAMPAWASGPGLVNVTHAEDEISVVCLAGRVPEGVECSRGWAAFQVSDLYDFDAPGVVLSAVRPVSEAGLGVFAVSTFYRDYLLVRQAERAGAEDAWRAAGHQVDAAAM